MCSRDEIRLKFVQIHIETAIETKWGSDARYNLSNETIEVSERRGADVEVFFADFIDSFIINLLGRKKCFSNEKIVHIRDSQPWKSSPSVPKSCEW